MRLICVVKGNRFIAARAAADRRIPFEFVKETRLNGENVETIGYVDDKFLPDLERWFDEHPASMKQPVSALLEFSPDPG